ncbi:MAG: efflux RND transporter periplasmic adaptor subunit [Gammaproteobacteria bacterium]|nr:efflux RND transporter periplasmic adaptor subunit [Gammaproteobacteria bacterium]MBU0771361.1 efflux RND transporter periplasmic adaptor subunit [Gammaproteobacteria bacterium]MBU0857123.1 efflux RND transporter periplasmic adaptor subunit [Gammaproteobacteria bacterium]MBU1848001.1 efflux RND transporter periplasmic adaptor subunit [Gammaproteobacteria bacterium]
MSDRRILAGALTGAITLWLALVAPALHAQAPATTAPAVRFVRFSGVALQPQRDAPAQAVALNRTDLAAEISARVASTHAEPGERVKKGQVLVRLDQRDYQLALERAQAQLLAAQARLAQADAQLRRNRALQEQNFVSPEALTQKETDVAVVRADVAVARNAVDQARHNLDKCVLRAPYDAVVRTRSASAGSLAAAGTLLMTLEDASRVEVSARVAPRDLASLRAARDVAFVSPAGRSAVSVNRVSPLIDKASRTQEVRATFTAERAPAGAEGRLAWSDPAPHVPAELLVRRAGDGASTLGVFVLRDGVARFVALPGAQEGRPAPAGLPPDARIATDGRNSLRDGQKITATP